MEQTSDGAIRTFPSRVQPIQIDDQIQHSVVGRSRSCPCEVGTQTDRSCTVMSVPSWDTITAPTPSLLWEIHTSAHLFPYAAPECHVLRCDVHWLIGPPGDVDLLVPLSLPLPVRVVFVPTPLAGIPLAKARHRTVLPLATHTAYAGCKCARDLTTTTTYSTAQSPSNSVMDKRVPPGQSSWSHIWGSSSHKAVVVLY